MISGLSYISSSAENLYKFLFINGTVLFILSMFYPLQQENEIRLLKVKHNENVELLNYDIATQKESIFAFQETIKEGKILLDSLSRNRDKNTSYNIQIKKNELKSAFDSIKNSKKKLDINLIKIQANKNQITELERQANNYGFYSVWLLVAGIVFFIIGLFGWAKATITLDKIKKQELVKLTKENTD